MIFQYLSYMRKVIHRRTADGTQVKARFFLLVDLREFFSDLGSGDEKIK